MTDNTLDFSITTVSDVPSASSLRQSRQFKSLSQYEKVPKEYKSKDSPSSSGLFQKNEKGQYNAATIVLIVFLVLIVVALIIAIIAVAVSPAGSACSCGPATTLGQGLANVVTSGQINSLVQYADKLKQKQYNAVTGNVTGNAVQYAPTFQPNAAPAVTNVPSMAAANDATNSPLAANAVLQAIQKDTWAVFKPSAQDENRVVKLANQVSQWMKTLIVDDETARLLDMSGSGTQVRRFDNGIGKQLFRGPLNIDTISMYLNSAGAKNPAPTKPVNATEPLSAVAQNFVTSSDNELDQDDQDEWTPASWGDDDVSRPCVFETPEAPIPMCSVILDQDPTDDVQSISRIVQRPKNNQLDVAFIPPVVGLEYLDP